MGQPYSQLGRSARQHRRIAHPSLLESRNGGHGLKKLPDCLFQDQRIGGSSHSRFALHGTSVASTRPSRHRAQRTHIARRGRYFQTGEKRRDRRPPNARRVDRRAAQLHRTFAGPRSSMHRRGDYKCAHTRKSLLHRCAHSSMPRREPRTQ